MKRLFPQRFNVHATCPAGKVRAKGPFRNLMCGSHVIADEQRQ